MRQYTRNVRRAWDGEDYRPPKRMRLQDDSAHLASRPPIPNQENLVDVEDNLERAIRETSVAAFSSSPSRKNSTVFSGESQADDGSSTTTPPSSPPPQSILQLTPPNVKPRKPTFSFLDKSKKEKPKPQSLKRKHDASTSTRDASEPLSEIHNSSTRALSSAPSVQSLPSVQPTFPGLIKTAVPQNLTQTRLDFGQSLAPITCPASDCGMTYTPSSELDTALHNMYHNRHSSGIELGRPFLKSAMKWCYEVPNIPGSVVVVDRKISLPSRKVVQKVLEVVNKELGSVDIGEEELWSQRCVPGDPDDARKRDRYKAFLHVIEGRCVGIALAERISRCHRVVSPASNEAGGKMSLNGNDSRHPQDHDQNQSQAEKQNPQYPTSSPVHHALTLSKETYPAVVGVSRIWTSKTFRRRGIANNLLDCVMNQFIYGMEIAREEVAFSQPTDAGAGLARSWFEEDQGWCVYVEE